MRSSAITSALMNRLRNDAALMALTPDGVFFNVAGDSQLGGASTRYVVVSLVAAVNVLEFGRVCYQDARYLVEAQLRTNDGNLTPVHDAAERIDALIGLPNGTLTIPGFRLMTIYQEEPTEFLEIDAADHSIQIARAGGQYRLFAAPAA